MFNYQLIYINIDNIWGKMPLNCWHNKLYAINDTNFSNLLDKDLALNSIV